MAEMTVTALSFLFGLIVGLTVIVQSLHTILPLGPFGAPWDCFSSPPFICEDSNMAHRSNLIDSSYPYLKSSRLNGGCARFCVLQRLNYAHSSQVQLVECR